MSALAERLATLPDRERREAVRDLVRSTTAELLGWEPAAVDVDRPYLEYGYNSMAAVELTRLLSAATGLELALTLLFDRPTPAAVADHLLAELGLPDAEPPPEPAAITPSDEPLAIVGMACRYPGGVGSPDELWDLVAAGREGISPFPADRGWDLAALFDDDPSSVATSHARAAGFLDDVAGFDAEFFGVGPREAVAMDPQQRLLLEVAWEAVEHAGIDPTSLRGSASGVFVGVSTQDYAWLARSGPGLAGYWGIGNAGSVASGRIAYKLGLEGPALTVDTACSSSLVALHLAGQSLRRGECSLALVGGAAVLATPTMFVEFSRQGGLSPDGRCRSFGAGADGTGWAEGAGMLLVERLSDAQRLGHQMLAVVRGSAVNSDGTSNGLTAPNGLAQQRVIRAALADAGLRPSDVDVVEAHGTGTTLGDPIEAEAIAATYGRDRARPLWLGSLKSNIGHAQAAAGVGGVIKMVQALRHSLLPATLHADEPTPKVRWDRAAVSLLTDPVPWRRNGSPRRAGVSAFGIGGTNAHVIVEEPPAAEPFECSPDLPVAWTLSARTPGALRAQAAALHRDLGKRAEPPVHIGHALATGRTRFAHRAAVVGETAGELLDGLAGLAAGELPANAARGVAGTRRLAILFTGQGSQRVGAGAGLAARYPAFDAALSAVCAEFDRHLDTPLREVMFSDAERLDQTRYTQPALFALEVALFRLVESWGVRPDFVMGHSIGELSAAHVAGVLSLADVCTLVAARGALMGALPPGGAMVAIEATETEVAPDLGPALSIAAINGPTAVVLAGAEEPVLAAAARWRERGRRTKQLRVSHAFHSPLIDPMLPAFAEVAAGLTYAEPTIPIVSNLTGALAGPEIRTPDYWVRHARGAVRFLDGMRALAGASAFLELGPTAALTALARQCVPADATLVSALRAPRPEPRSVLTALAELHVSGVTPDWPAVLGVDAPPVPLPTYAFQRERYWIDATPPPPPPPSTQDDPVVTGSVLDLVRTHLAAVLGHPDTEKIDPDRTLFELGLDSIGGAELHRKLAGATGADLSPTLLIDNTTPAEVADALRATTPAPTAEAHRTAPPHQANAPQAARSPIDEAHPAGPPTAPQRAEVRAAAPPTNQAPPAGPPAAASPTKPNPTGPRPEPVARQGALTALVRQAHADGRLPEIVPLLAEASRFRPAAHAAKDLDVRPVLVSDGPTDPTLVCLPSFLAGSGPHQFARLAAGLRNRRRVCALPLPGFAEGSSTPGSWAVAVEALAEATQRAARGGPVVLVGYSIGGVVAHAVAADLARAGNAPGGLVMIDTFEPVAEQRAATFGWAMGQVIDRDHDFLVLDDSAMLAMGGYLRIFDEWRQAPAPAPAPAPSLLLRAENVAGGRHANAWSAADTIVPIPGDHFSILERDVPSTATALESWLER
jgi:acyl transferase domain-containing protein